MQTEATRWWCYKPIRVGKSKRGQMPSVGKDFSNWSLSRMRLVGVSVRTATLENWLGRAVCYSRYLWLRNSTRPRNGLCIFTYIYACVFYTYFYIRNFKAGLLVRAPNCKQLKSPSRVEWIPNAQNIHRLLYGAAVAVSALPRQATLAESHSLNGNWVR